MPDEPTSSITPHEQVLISMREMAAKMEQSGMQLRMPPRSVETLGTHYTEIRHGKMLAAEVPFHEEFCNPTGVMQGGFLCAASDDVFGPLSYMAARRPAVTIEMNTSFIRPFLAKDRVITIRAEVVSVSRSLVLIEGKATRPDGKLVAISKVHCSVLPESPSQKSSAGENSSDT